MLWFWPRTLRFMVGNTTGAKTHSYPKAIGGVRGHMGGTERCVAGEEWATSEKSQASMFLSLNLHALSVQRTLCILVCQPHGSCGRAVPTTVGMKTPLDLLRLMMLHFRQNIFKSGYVLLMRRQTWDIGNRVSCECDEDCHLPAKGLHLYICTVTC